MPRLSRITRFVLQQKRGEGALLSSKIFFFVIVLSFRFWRAFFFGRRRRQSLSLCRASKRVDRNVCRGSVVSVGLDAFRGDKNLLSVRGGGGGAREEEEEEEENFSKG